MPGLRRFLVSQGYPKDDITEHMKLLLPSSIPASQRGSVCLMGLAEIECCLRLAQAMEALSGLRRHLRTRIMAQKLSDKDASSQRAYLQSRSLQDQVEKRIRTCQVQYTTARNAVLALRGPGDWENKLRVLKPEDVRGISERSMNNEEKEEYRRTRLMAGLSDAAAPNDADSNVPMVQFDPRLALGEGKRTLSWIWYSVSDEELRGNSPNVHASECRCRVFDALD